MVGRVHGGPMAEEIPHPYQNVGKLILNAKPHTAENGVGGENPIPSILEEFLTASSALVFTKRMVRVSRLT